MRARSSLLLLLASSLLLSYSPKATAQANWQGGIGLDGPQVPDPGVPEISLGSRFLPLHVQMGIPAFGLNVGTWAGGGLGLRYSSAGAYLGNPHEFEFSLKQRLLDEERGAPVTASLLGAVNTGAYSLDGELALSRQAGPLTMLGTARLLGNADGARLPLGGVGIGARYALLPQVALLGDVFQVVNEAGAKPAWGAGVQLQLPQIPYAVTLHVSNTPSATRQGASLGTSDLRFGVDLALVLPGWQPASRPAAQPSLAAELSPTRNVSSVESARPEAPVPVLTADARPASAEPAKVAAAPAATAHAANRSEEARPPARPAPKPQPPSVMPQPKPTPRPVSKPAARPAKNPKAAVKASPAPTRNSHAKPAAAAKRESELWIVMIRNGQPTPAQVTLQKGSSVTWFNRDASAHELVAPGWKSGSLGSGKQITRRFDQVGVIRYHCRLHPNEGGTITVR